MTVTIPDVMRHVRNHFVTGSLAGSWSLTEGSISPSVSELIPGAWIAIPDGPLRGVHQLDEYGALPDASDTAWTGRILLLEPPQDFLRLCSEIAQWAREHADPTLTSERFGEYSRQSTSGDWTQVFASTLAPYTRMYPEVNV